jgi:hypothetical protein
MTCPKCTGCLFWNFEEWYCCNCGWRDNAPLPIPPREPYWRKKKLDTVGKEE